jgi:hypothetical protein
MAGRRFGHHVGGWVVGLPLTSGPVAFFLATDQGASFAAAAAVGMLAGTISQVAFAFAYRTLAHRGATSAFLLGACAFAAATVVLSFLHWGAAATFAVVCAILIVASMAAARTAPGPLSEPRQPPRWDIPARMLAATTVVLLITGLAPVLGPHVAGLLSPFPVFGAVLALFAHQTHGPSGASQVLSGLLLGLFAPAVFFVALALALPSVGLWAFVIATSAALTTHGLTMLAIPREQDTTAP